jgi:hypothetical protein
MSTLVVNKVEARDTHTLLNTSGNIIQVVYARTDARNTYASAVTGDGTTITDLNISITPTNANNRLICQWMINCEVDWNNVLLIHRDGALITTVGEEGRNNISNNRWVGYSPFRFEGVSGDVNSTMENIFVMYSQIAGSTTSRTYAPAVRASGSTAYTFFLNRTAGSTGQDIYENTVSTAVIYEVVV